MSALRKRIRRKKPRDWRSEFDRVRADFVRRGLPDDAAQSWALSRMMKAFMTCYPEYESYRAAAAALGRICQSDLPELSCIRDELH